MNSVFIEHCRAVIADAPGPAPWYIGQAGSDLSTLATKLAWQRDPSAGPSELMDGDQRTYALASTYTYVRRLGTARFVVWYKSGRPENGEVHLQLYRISSLQPMTDRQAAFARLTRAYFAAAASPSAQLSIPRNLPAGLHTLQLPTEFADCPELFVLVSNGNTWDDVGLNLWLIDPSRQQIQVVSQDWFTKGAYDFGYQWVTRVARDPETGNLVGDGIRIGQFILNEDGSRFLAWLKP